MPEDRINKGLVGKGIMLFTVLLSWGPSCSTPRY